MQVTVRFGLHRTIVSLGVERISKAQPLALDGLEALLQHFVLTIQIVELPVAFVVTISHIDQVGVEHAKPGLAFERSHTILGLRAGVHTPSGGVNTGSVHTENVVFTREKRCSHSVCHIFQQTDG
eukprot:964002-Prymnesium_polylepis.1